MLQQSSISPPLFRSLCKFVKDSYLVHGHDDAAAMTVLARLSSRPHNVPRLLREGALELALDAVHSPAASPAQRAAAADLLARLCAVDAARVRLFAPTADAALNSIVAAAALPDPAAQPDALRAAAALSASPDLAQRLVEAGLLTHVTRLLRAGSPAGADLQLAALAAASGLARHPALREAMGERGLVAAAVRQCVAGDGGEQGDADAARTAEAMRLLALLSESAVNCPRIVAAGGYPALQRVARWAGGPAGLREAAQGLLGRLVHIHDAARIDAVVRKAVRKMRRPRVPAAEGPLAALAAAVAVAEEASAERPAA